MANLSYRISLSHAAQLDLAAGITAAVLPLVNQAVNAIAQATAANWIEAVQRASLWSGEKDAYAKSISYRMTGDFSAMVETDYQHAQDIETGRPPRDLKKMLSTSNKVRTTSKGTRYLIIPFRHNADTVPQEATMMTASRIIGHTNRVSGTGAYSLQTKSPMTVRQRVYSWGDRLKGADIARNQQGMVRFDTTTRKGGQRSSSYLTFRVMSEKSTGWIVPAKPGLFIAQGVAQAMQPLAEQAFAEAFRRT